MNFIDKIYKQSLTENERYLCFWQDYLSNLNDLDFSVYSDKLTVPILVPIGNKILFRGCLKHTNEVTVALGADYFAKCSIKQAEELRQHRIKDAKSKIDLYTKEKEYLENQLSFNKSKVYESPGQDIIETCTEDEDKLWREQHRERVRQYNKSGKKKEESAAKDITDEELWARLEELELQEELENEYRSMTNREDDSDTDGNESFIVKDEDNLKFPEDTSPKIGYKNSNDLTNNNNPKADEQKVKLSKLDLFKQVIDKQRELEVKLTELKYKERDTCKTEKDLISKLDEMEQLEELEDEMDRLDDILNEDSDDSAGVSETKPTKHLKKSVSFADDDESETLELTFKHSDMTPDMEPYSPDKGITKPSDIYEAFSNLFIDDATTSILKKSKPLSPNEPKISLDTPITTLPEKESPRQTIVVKDIVEKTNSDDLTCNQSRPVSLFKKRRQQQT